MTPEQSLDVVLELGGGVTAVARRLGISPQAVWQWRVAPPKQCQALAAISGGQVTAQQLRPDIFGAVAPANEQAAA